MNQDAKTRKLLLKAGAALLLFVLLGSGGSVVAQDSYVDRTQDIKAAYLYNFGKYVTWPASSVGRSTAPKDDFVIGIVGNSPLKNALAKVAKKKTIAGRKIRVEVITEATKAASCNLVYFPGGQTNPLYEQIANTLQGRSSLLVGEHPGFAESGGMINFYAVDNKVKFEINTSQAKVAGLSISSKLLRLGRQVGVKQ